MPTADYIKCYYTKEKIVRPFIANLTNRLTIGLLIHYMYLINLGWIMLVNLSSISYLLHHFTVWSWINFIDPSVFIPWALLILKIQFRWVVMICWVNTVGSHAYAARWTFTIVGSTAMKKLCITTCKQPTLPLSGYYGNVKEDDPTASNLKADRQKAVCRKK